MLLTYIYCFSLYIFMLNTYIYKKGTKNKCRLFLYEYSKKIENNRLTLFGK